MTAPKTCPGCGYDYCPQHGDECWKNSGCPSTPSKPAPSAEPDFSYRLLSHLPNLERLTIASLREALSRAGLAIVSAADVPGPIGDETLRHLIECAHAWEPDACLFGNVTARQLQALCVELARLRADVPSAEERKVLEVLGDVPKTLIGDWRRWPSGWLMLLAKAELARRAAQTRDQRSVRGSSGSRALRLSDGCSGDGLCSIEAPCRACLDRYPAL